MKYSKYLIVFSFVAIVFSCSKDEETHCYLCTSDQTIPPYYHLEQQFCGWSQSDYEAYIRNNNNATGTATCERQ